MADASRTIRTIDLPLQHTIRVPGSKSIANRALILGALYCERCRLRNLPESVDIEVMIAALRSLGWQVEGSEEIALTRPRHLWPHTEVKIDVRDSGTAMRFLTAFCAAGRGRITLDGSARLRERPMRDLLDALEQMGAAITSHGGVPPIVVEGRQLAGGTITVRAELSSQFLSAILLIAPLAAAGLTVTVQGPIASRPYAEMTVAMMRQWGLSIQAREQQYHIEPKSCLMAEFDYEIEPDASSASYWFTAAAIAGGSVTVPGIRRGMLQGDVRFAELLQQMGCEFHETADGLTISRNTSQPLRGIEADLNDIPDTVPTLAAAACFAASPTTIRNVAHIRHKESDRIAALAAELRKLGVKVKELADSLTIHPRPMRGGTLNPHNDHRLAMSLALMGLKVPGVVIENPGCVAKSYPGFWQEFERLYSSAS